MTVTGLGVDVSDTRRFRRFRKDEKNRFLTNNFSKRELDYCFSFKDPTEHLAGIFAAKEAVFKSFGKTDFLFSLVEIRRGKEGKPSVYLKNRQIKSVFLSISHGSNIAIAIAIRLC